MEQNGFCIGLEIQPIEEDARGGSSVVPTGQPPSTHRIFAVVVAEDFEAERTPVKRHGVDAAFVEWAHAPELVFVHEKMRTRAPTKLALWKLRMLTICCAVNPRGRCASEGAAV